MIKVVAPHGQMTQRVVDRAVQVQVISPPHMYMYTNVTHTHTHITGI